MRKVRILLGIVLLFGAVGTAFAETNVEGLGSYEIVRTIIVALLAVAGTAVLFKSHIGNNSIHWSSGSLDKVYLRRGEEASLGSIFMTREVCSLKNETLVDKLDEIKASNDKSHADIIVVLTRLQDCLQDHITKG